jgi:uncharacterized membrane protein (DUF4010 family)
MTTQDAFASLGLATAAGLLIGLERERSAPRDRRVESFLGGARTHPLVALVGGLSALAARELGVAALVVPFAGLVVLVLLDYAGEVYRDRDRGLTSEAAFILTFLLGVLSLSERALSPLSTRALVILAVAVVTAFLLSAKPAIHPLVSRISAQDLASALGLLVLAVVVLPILPDRAYGPYDALNPFQIGVLIVLISAISFAGYAGVRVLGPRRGLGLTGLLGGLASSTAVTLAMSSRAREKPAIADSAALAVMLASTMMFVRVLVVVGLVSPSLLGWLAYPMVAAAAAGAGTSLVFWRRSRTTGAGSGVVAFSNPFEIAPALRFAAVFAVVLVGAKAATVHLGEAGAYVAGVVAGSTDVDAITLSMARLSGRELPPQVAATAIFLGTASNTVVKGVMSLVVGGWPFGRRILGAQLATLAVGAAGLALTWRA